MQRLAALARNPRVLSFLDQASFSFGNFVVLIAFARGFGADEVAGYGIGFSIVILLQSIYRIAFVIPMTLASDEAFAADRRGYAGQHAIILGGLLALALVAWIGARVLALPPIAVTSAAAAFATLASFLPQDFERAFLLRAGRQMRAVAASITFIPVTLAVAGLIALGAVSYEEALLALAVFGTIRTVGLLALLPRTSLAAGAHLIAGAVRGGSASWNMLGTVASAGFVHAPLLILGTFAPAINVAAYTAVRAPMQPLQILVRSLDVVDKVLFGRIDIENAVARRHHLRRTYALYLAVGVVCATALGLFAEPIIALMFGPRYAGFEGTMRLWGAIFVLVASSLPLETAILSARHYRSYALMQCAGGALAVVSAVPLSYAYLDFGAVLACLIGWGLTYGLMLHRAYRDVGPR